MLRAIRTTQVIEKDFKILLSLSSATACSQAVPGRVAAELVSERRGSVICVEPGGQRVGSVRGCC